MKKNESVLNGSSLNWERRKVIKTRFLGQEIQIKDYNWNANNRDLSNKDPVLANKQILFKKINSR